MKKIKDSFLIYKNKLILLRKKLSKRYEANKQRIVNLNLFEIGKDKNKTKTNPTDQAAMKNKFKNLFKFNFSKLKINNLIKKNSKKISRIKSKKKKDNLTPKNKKYKSFSKIEKFSKFKLYIKENVFLNSLKNKFDSLSKVKKFDDIKLFIQDNDLIDSLKNKYKSFSKIEKFSKFKLLVKENDLIDSLKSKYNKSLSKLTNKFTSKIKTTKKDSYEKTTDFIGIFYNENDLYFAPLTIRNKLVSFKNLIKVDIPTDVIGETKIENIDEFTEILKSIIEVVGLQNPNIILFLGSSFFTVRSFDENKIASFSHSSDEILSKSPFLPHNTLLTSYKVTEKSSHSFYRVAFLEKESIDTWAKSLSLLENEIVTITSPIFSLLKKVSLLNVEKITVICDIEKFSTTVYLQKIEGELFNTKLPYGASLYISADSPSNQHELFLIRLQKSVSQIVKNNNFKEEIDIYLTGVGLNLLFDNRKTIDSPFKRIPPNISRNYEFEEESVKNLEKDYLSIFEFFSTYCEEIK